MEKFISKNQMNTWREGGKILLAILIPLLLLWKGIKAGDTALIAYFVFILLFRTRGKITAVFSSTLFLLAGTMLILNEVEVATELSVIALSIFTFGIFMEKRWAATTALSLLGITPILIILKQKPLAEQLAVYAYYLLLLAVLLNFSENLHNKKEKVEEE